MPPTSAGETLDALADRTSPTVVSAAELRPGDLVGRYVILARLGGGGMGVVYAAYDPELDRKVALKLLRSDLGGTPSSGGLRLLREAQALARLSHPHVVAIHDVGTVALGRPVGDAEPSREVVWLAMEFVAGSTLSAWLAEKPRTWREVLAVMIPVARGLAAAHECGLVHRDVKPDNVMLGSDGRVRVADFGLARGTKASSEADEDAADGDDDDDGDDEAGGAPTGSRRYLDMVATRIGATPGTPAYMAPEQIAGAVADARADQFSFCVTLWEALHRERPFAGATLVELAGDILGGRVRRPPRDPRIPAWLRRVVRRGLSVQPERRWASLGALVEAIDRAERRARASRVAVVVGAVAFVGVGVWGAAQLDERRRIAACAEAGASIDEIWNDEARAAVRSAFLATGAGQAATTLDKTLPWLDAQADAWRAARADACVDAEVRGTWGPDLAERSAWCLEDRRLELHALVGRLRAADDDTVMRAVQAAAALTDVGPCRDADLLTRLPAPPQGDRDGVDTVRSELSRAAALRATAAYDEGRTAAERGLQAAIDLGWPPLVVRARRQVGNLLADLGEYAEAESILEAAYFEAVAVGATDDAIAAAQSLTRIVGHELARPTEGARWARHADVLRITLPDPSGLREAASATALGTVRDSAGAYDEAGDLYARALELQRQALPEDHPAIARSLNNLAGVQHSKGDDEEAARLHEQALRIRERALGPDHPDVAASLNNLGIVMRARGDLESAERLQARALAIYRASLGPEHPLVATTLSNLATVHHATGDHVEASRLEDEALRIREKALGSEHPDVAETLHNTAIARRAMGDTEGAARLGERALSIWEKAYGADHPHVAASLNNLANLRTSLGEPEVAAELAARALAIWEKTLGPDHRHVSSALDSLADARRELGDPEGAEGLYARALGIRERALGPTDPALSSPLLGLARVALARHRPADAVAAAERAVDVLKGLGATSPELAEARTVLAQAVAARDAAR